MNLKPSKIVCVGLNYKDHAAELNQPLPNAPLLFLKPPSALNYDQGKIVYPPQTKELHYEGELAIVIKDRIKNITTKEALDHVLGFTCANDVTARDLQRLDGQWTRAKSFDTFCPVGPRLVKDIDTADLAIKLYLNGQVKQSSRTSQMVFNVPHLVAYISQMMTLEAEDIILTGTPSGIGPMQIEDEVVVEIEGIGRLTNRIVSSELKNPST
jgi:2-keto-4-pentenoate hydratase/2-oxohepta-3-ene-1,7-dioic acid hydratase in catechol pathway